MTHDDGRGGGGGGILNAGGAWWGLVGLELKPGHIGSEFYGVTKAELIYPSEVSSYSTYVKPGLVHS